MSLRKFRQTALRDKQETKDEVEDPRFSEMKDGLNEDREKGRKVKSKKRDK